MEKLGIICFNTASMNEEIRKSNLVDVIDLHISISGESFISNDLNKLEQEVKAKKEIPKTSQPTTGEIINAYQKNLEKFEDVLVLTPDKNLSGTHQNAILAKSMLEENKDNIHIIELKSFAIIEGVACLRAINFIKEQKDIEYIKKDLSLLADNLTSYIIPGSFDYLKMSGRVNLSKAIISKLLSLNIIIKHKDGEAGVYKKARGFKGLLKAIAEDLKQEDNVKEIWISDVQADKKEFEKIKSILKKYENVKYLPEGSLIMASHFGPKTIGYSIIKNY